MKRFLIFLLLVTASPVLADVSQTPLTLHAAPVFTDIKASPGDRLERQMTLTNDSAVPVAVTVEARGFEATDEYGGSDYPDQSAPSATQHWFSFSPSEFLLAPHAERAVAITIQVPKDASAGGHYASVFFNAVAPSVSDTGNAVNLTARIGSFYFFTIGGDLHPSGHFSSVSVPALSQKPPVTFSLAFENTGNIHVKPRSQIIIKDMFGRVTGQLDDLGQYVLPGKVRRWKVAWSPGWAFGPYRAVISTVVAPGLPTETKTVGFWVLPILPIILLAFIIFSGTYIMVKFARGEWTLGSHKSD